MPTGHAMPARASACINIFYMRLLNVNDVLTGFEKRGCKGFWEYWMNGHAITAMRASAYIYIYYIDY